MFLQIFIPGFTDKIFCQCNMWFFSQSDRPPLSCFSKLHSPGSGSSLLSDGWQNTIILYSASRTDIQLFSAKCSADCLLAPAGIGSADIDAVCTAVTIVIMHTLFGFAADIHLWGWFLKAVGECIAPFFFKTVTAGLTCAACSCSAYADIVSDTSTILVVSAVYDTAV